MKKKNFSVDIFVYSLIGMLSVILLFSLVCLKYQRESIYDKIDSSIQNTLVQSVNSIDQKMQMMESLMQYFRGNPTIQQALLYDADYKVTKSVYQIISDLGNSKLWSRERITLVGQSGQVFVNWENDGRVQYSEFVNYLKERLEDSQDVLNTISYQWSVEQQPIGDMYEMGEYIQLIAYIYNSLGTRPVGIISIDLPSSEVLYVLGDGKLFDNSVMQVCDVQNTQLLVVDAADERMQQEEKEPFTFSRKLSCGWELSMLVPYSEYVENNTILFNSTLGMVLGAVVAAFVMASLISYNISKPIKELETSVYQITNGEFHGRVNVQRSDSIGKLAIHFNHMVDNLERLIEERAQSLKRETELRLANQTAELKVLYAQMNPHFLFNTLNSIRCLAIINGDKYVARMLESLGAILENSMMKGEDRITLEKEIALITKYIELQQMRYGERLKSEISLELGLERQEIPRFLLQPLVENAIIHGISKKQQGGTVKISVRSTQDRLLLEVEDDALGIEEKSVSATEHPDKRNGIAMENIRKRLELLYGKKSFMKVEKGSFETGTKVSIVLPIESKELTS